MWEHHFRECERLESYAKSIPIPQPAHGVRGFGPTLPFVIWRFRSHTIWPEASVAAYLLTAWLLLTLMIGYPGPGNRWYWKPVAVMVILHTAVLSGLTIGAVAIIHTGVKPPIAMFFGLLVVVLAMESWIAMRLFANFLNKATRRANRGSTA